MIEFWLAYDRDYLFWCLVFPWPVQTGSRIEKTGALRKVSLTNTHKVTTSEKNIARNDYCLMENFWKHVWSHYFCMRRFRRVPLMKTHVIFGKRLSNTRIKWWHLRNTLYEIITARQHISKTCRKTTFLESSMLKTRCIMILLKSKMLNTRCKLTLLKYNIEKTRH